MKTITRDDTEHGEEYVLRSEAEAAIQAAIKQANLRQTASCRLMCDKMMAAVRERCAAFVQAQADDCKPGSEVQMRLASVAACLRS